MPDHAKATYIIKQIQKTCQKYGYSIRLANETAELFLNYYEKAGRPGDSTDHLSILRQMRADYDKYIGKYLAVVAFVFIYNFIFNLFPPWIVLFLCCLSAYFIYDLFVKQRIVKSIMHVIETLE